MTDESIDEYETMVDGAKNDSGTLKNVFEK